MKHRPLYLAALVACLGMGAAASTAATAMQDASPAPPPPPSAPPGTPPVPPGPPMNSVQRNAHVTGVIERFLVNPNGDVDGVLLKDNTQVSFAPPTGNMLSSKVKAGDRLVVDGFRLGSLPFVRASSIALPNGDTLTDTPPAPPPTPPQPPPLKPMDANGRVLQPLYGPRGDVAGVIMEGGPIVRVPPPAAQDNPLLRPGAHLSAKGFGIDSPFGRAMQATALGAAPGAEQPVGPPPRPGDLPPDGAAPAPRPLTGDSHASR